ncbi:addiction module toxin RelE [Methylorubrum populi]|nr:addiction module toxin RelE [Methylorubrum populi]
MLFNVISRNRLSDFWAIHPQAEGPLTAWFAAVTKTEWTGPAHLKAAFGSADFVADNRVIFNVGGNNYRVIARFAYVYKTAQIKFVGTHAEYDLVDAATVGNPNEKQERKRKGKG